MIFANLSIANFLCEIIASNLKLLVMVKMWSFSVKMFYANVNLVKKVFAKKFDLFWLVFLF